MSKILGGCTSVSIVRATVGLLCRAGSFGAFFVVHMTISAPFQMNAIGTLRGVPSLATYAKRVMSRANSSWLIGRLRTSVISFGCTVIPPVVVLGRSKRIVLVGRGSAATGELAELLGQRDDDSLGAADVADPVAVLVLRHPSHELRALGPHAGDGGVDVVDREHDAP